MDSIMDTTMDIIMGTMLILAMIMFMVMTTLFTKESPTLLLPLTALNPMSDTNMSTMIFFI